MTCSWTKTTTKKGRKDIYSRSYILLAYALEKTDWRIYLDMFMVTALQWESNAMHSNGQ